MARNKQKLINYHGSNRVDATIQGNLVKGEIAVLHGANAAGTMLGTLDDNSNLVWFISSAAVYSAIDAVSGGATGQIDNLKNAVSALSSTTVVIESNLDSVSAATKPMLTAVTMSAPTTGAVTGNYIQFTTAITGSDYNKVETIGTKLDVIQTAAALSAVTATGQVADALAIKGYVEGASSALQGQIDGTNGKLTQLSSSTVALKDTVDKALDGLTIDDNNSIKTYVDSKVGDAVSKAYTVKGSVNDYAALTAMTASMTSANTGDVYNVVSAGTSAVTPDHKAHSEGTNWVWTGSEWDALGGTVDLSNYVTNGEFTPVKEAAESALQGISGYSSNAYITLVNNNKSAFTITENVATSFGSIASTTKQVADAYGIQEYVKTMKNEAVTSAYTASSALTYNVETGITSQINGVSDRVQTIENSNVYNSAATAVTFTALTDIADAAKNQNNAGAVAVIEDKTLKIDLDCLTIDCGTWE